MRLTTFTLVTIASFGITLASFWSRATYAEEIADYERQGEWDEDGAKFGNIVVKGELVADAAGWVLVRTMENKGEEPETCRVEERVLRTETMPNARVEPPPFAVVLRGVTITLGAHEKRKIGIPLAASIGEEITANLRAKAEIEAGRFRAIEAERYKDPVFERTYHYFSVQYLKPLPPGATAAKPDTGVTHPAAMPAAL